MTSFKDDLVTDQPTFDVVGVEVDERLEQGVAVDAADDGRDAGHHEVEGLLVDVLGQKPVLLENKNMLSMIKDQTKKIPIIQ